MFHKRPIQNRGHAFADVRLLSRDETIALFVALVCSACCVLFLMDLPTPAIGEEVEGADEISRLAEGFTDALNEGVRATTTPAPSNPMPLIIVVAIMGVALAIAFVVSRCHAKPQKLGGAKGDVW